MKLLFMPSPLPSYCVSLTFAYPPQQPFLKIPQPMFLPKCESKFHTHAKQEKLQFCEFESLYFFIANVEAEDLD